MATPEISTKRLAISKANAQTVAIVAVAAFITVFCLVATKAALSQNRYQARLTTAKDKAHKQLVANITAYDQLQKSYTAFDSSSTNVLGGNTSGSGDNDGTNSKLILDALPSSYDFPALTSSVEKILTDRGLHISSISGTDDQVNQQGNQSSDSPQAVQMPFTFTVDNASYQAVGQALTALQQSIRPVQVDNLTISGGSDDMTITVNAHTYYQPAKNVNIGKKVVK